MAGSGTPAYSFALPSLRGFSFSFWMLQGYLFLCTSQLDEHSTFLAAFRWRFGLGILALATAFGRLQGQAAAERAAMFRLPQTKWLIAYAAVSAAATLWAYDPKLAWPVLEDHLTVALSFFLLIAIVRTRAEFLVTVLVIAAGVGTFMMLSLWEWFHGRNVFTMGVVRMIGIGLSLQDPNTFAATLAFSAPLVAWLGVHVRAWWVRVSAAGYYVAMPYCLINASSRSGFVLLVLVAIWFLVTLPERRTRLTVLVFALAGTAALSAGLTDNQRERIAGILKSETYEEDSSTMGRIEGVRVGLRMVTDHPVLGVGPGNWAAYRVGRVDGSPLNPHNLAGMLLGTVGLAGTLTFVGYIVSSIAFGLRNASRGRRAKDPWDRAVGRFCTAAVFILFLMLVSGLGAHNLYRANWFWVPALAIVAARCRESNALKESSAR